MGKYRVDTEGGSYIVETEDGQAPPAAAPTAAPSKPGNWLGSVADYGRGLWSVTSPATAVKSLAGAAADPIGTAKGMFSAQGDLAYKAKAAFESGDYATGLRHSLEYLVPILGPQLASSGDKAASGKVAEALGEATGIGLQAVAPNALRGIRGIRVTPRITNANPQVATAVASEQAAGVPVPAGAATGNAFVRTAQKLAETTPGGSLVGSSARQNLSEALATRGRELTRRAAPTPQIPETAGAAVRSGVEDAISRLKTDAEAAYGGFEAASKNPRNVVQVQTGTKTVTGKIIDPTTGQPRQITVPITEKMSMPVDMRDIKAALKPKLEDMNKWLEPAKRNASAGYQAVKSIVQGPDYLPAATAEKGLGGLKSLSREAVSADLRTESQGIAAGVVSQLQKRIDAAAERGGALNDLKVGRSAHATKMEAAEVLQKLRDEPVQVFNQATFQADSGIEQLRAIQKYAPKEMPKVGRAYLEKLMDQATSEGGFQHGARLWSQWEKLGPETKKILFRNPVHVQDLDNFFLVAKRIAEEPNPSMTAVVGHSTGAAGLLVMNPVAGIAYNLGAAALTKLLYSPAGVRALTRGLTVPIGNRAAGAAAATAILKAAGDDAKKITNENRPSAVGELSPARP